LNKEDAFVKHAGKHNTYYCSEEHYKYAVDRKKKREEFKKRQAMKSGEV
jgi:hypothetical protein